MNPAEIATLILNLYQGNQAAWTRGVAARDRSGRECATSALGVCCWCLIGAMQHLAIPLPSKLVFAKHLTGSQDYSMKALADWNDSHTFQEVEERLQALAKGRVG